MIIDGRALAKKLEEGLKDKFASRPTRLAIILVGNDVPSRQFVNLKKRFGERVGVEVQVHEYETGVSEEDLIELIARLNNDDKTSGIIIQLPLPGHLNSEKLANLISANKDVDALGTEAIVLSPVVGAVSEILHSQRVTVKDKKVLVLGRGKLVGWPIAIWLTQQGAKVETADKNTKNVFELLPTAEIIVTGIGQPYFIKPTMLKEGVVLIDAGSSESAGQVVGDADPACAAKCSLFTPVPGGVGPITVAKLFENLLLLTK